MSSELVVSQYLGSQLPVSSWGSNVFRDSQSKLRHIFFPVQSYQWDLFYRLPLKETPHLSQPMWATGASELDKKYPKRNEEDVNVY